MATEILTFDEGYGDAPLCLCGNDTTSEGFYYSRITGEFARDPEPGQSNFGYLTCRGCGRVFVAPRYTAEEREHEGSEGSVHLPGDVGVVVNFVPAAFAAEQGDLADAA